jgi:hypothetical protein
MKECKLCGRGLTESEIWPHLVFAHPRELEKELPVRTFRCPCGREFRARVEARADGKFYRPYFCPRCIAENRARRIVYEEVSGGG